MSGRRLIAAPFALALLVACGPTTDTPDAGLADAGPTDAGGEVVDAGPVDAGCADPECIPCAEGGLFCEEGFACDETDQRCKRPCIPGDVRCEGLLTSTCGEDGFTWSEPAHCEGEALCREGACVAVGTCESETPACCSLPRHCGTVSQPRTCAECRSIVRGGYCIAGACEPAPDTLAIDFVGDGSEMLPTDRIAVESGIITVYRGVAADGRPVTCEWLLADDGAGTPHDNRDPRLNATVLKVVNYSGPGNDIYNMLIMGVPAGTDQTVVYSLYDRANAEGTVVGRGCLDGADLTVPEDQIVIDLFSQ